VLGIRQRLKVRLAAMDRASRRVMPACVSFASSMVLCAVVLSYVSSIYRSNTFQTALLK
jgi:hypothetical protein